MGDTYTSTSKTGSTVAETGRRRAQAKKEGDYETVEERTEESEKGIAARTGTGADVDEDEPKRADFPPGLAGQAAWNKARGQYRQKKSGDAVAAMPNR